MPHHLTQRGNRRQETFFQDDDYRAYLELMAASCNKHDVEVWAYCLMPNHVHLIAVPHSEDGLRLAIGEAHRRYTRRVNFREGWKGHLWQGRFASFVLDEKHLLAAARYIELNPVRAKLTTAPSDYLWSSARAHIRKKDDVLVKVRPLLLMTRGWKRFLTSAASEEQIETFRRHERTGRPLGDEEFLERLEKELGRVLKRQKTGPKVDDVK
jgi:putative transposase